MIWRIEYSGFADVEADTQAEAEEMFDSDYYIYDEEQIDSIYVAPD